MTVKTASALALTGLVLVVAAIGCGGDDSASSDETTTEVTTTTDGTTTDGTTTSGSESGTLRGETGPGFEIEVSRHGEDVETLQAGTYTLDVEDKSDIHNFHLLGPGVDEEVTDVAFVGEKTVTVTLEPGTYTYQCDPHEAQGMKGTFTVT